MSEISVEAFTPLQVLGGLKAAAGGASTVLQTAMAADQSLIKYTQPCRVEPFVLVDQSLQHDPSLTDALHVMSNLFTGYYLQAVSLMTTVNGVAVVGKLDRVNPNRQIGGVVGSAVSSFESYAVSLPTFTSKNVGLESAPVMQVASNPNAPKNNAQGASSVKVGESVKEINNLIVGKIVEVKFRDGNGEYCMPITIRLTPLSTTPLLLRAILGSGAYEFNMKERWHKWRAGEISLIGDLVFCNDLIARHKKILHQDTHGFYAEAMARRGRNAAASVLSGEPSLATASNMVIMSARTAAELERELGSKLSVFKTREDAMSATSLMMMMVIDPDYERVTLYSRSIPVASTFTIRDLKSLNKGNGPDITEIMKALMDRSAPLR